MSFLLSHSTLEFNIWAFLALLLCIAVAVYWYFGMKKLNKEKEALEATAADIAVDAAANAAAQTSAAAPSNTGAST